MTAAGRVLHAGLELLDRQLVDRQGRCCGKVDDLELEPLGADDGPLYVTALHTGPGALLTALGHAKAGAWLRRAVTGAGDDDVDPTRIPFGRVARIGDHVDLAVEAEDLATHTTERWTRDHVIAHIPGSDHDAPE